MSSFYSYSRLTSFPDSFSFFGIDGLRVFDIFIDFSGISIFFFIFFKSGNLIKVFLCLADKKNITNLENARDDERTL